MRLLVRAALLAAVLAAVAAPMATAQVDVNCYSPSKTNCSGQWHKNDVTIQWIVVAPFVPRTGCVNQTIRRDTRGETWGCFAETPTGDTASREVTIKVDRTPPLLGAPVPARPPDMNSWYRSPVRIAFTGTDATSGIEGCTETTYGTPDSASATVVGVCRDHAGNATSGTFKLRFDATPPTVTGMTPARPPDHGSWYTRPIGFSFSGSDALSGLAGCDPVVYGGPDSAAAMVQGTCRDRAGNVATRAFNVPFDGTAPQLGKMRKYTGDRIVRLDWAAAGAAQVEVSRSPGRRGADRTVLYRGSATRLVDDRVRNGRRYAYHFVATDQAGNVAERSIGVVPGPRLLAPRAGARLTKPPVLRWTPVRGAQYYNVQLFHRGRKVLSAWPGRPRLALRRAWKHHGRGRLEPGRYRWMVWPGKGERADNRYGALIGRRTFVIAPAT